MKLQVITADPAKNITVFVLTPVDRADYIPVSRALLARRELCAEQVAFICPPLEDGTGRMEMMGGEFCGNASRSFGLYLARQKGMRGECGVPVSVSGCGNILTVDVNTDTGYAQVEMPLPRSQEVLNVEGLGALDAYHFEGITHIVAPDVPAERGIFDAIKKAAERAFSFDALGVMFYDSKTGGVTPAVYVSGTDSLVFESSCGSGTAAVAAWLSRKSKSGTFAYDVPQPGGVLRAAAVKENGRITKIQLGGVVHLGEAIGIDIDI